MRILSRFFRFTVILVLVVVLIPIAIIAYDFYRMAVGVYYVDLAPVTGFAESYSFQQGDPIPLFIHSTEPAELSVSRLEDDWRPVGEPTPVAAQNQSNRYHRKNGLEWKESLVVDSASLSPGLYRFDLRQLNKSNASFSIPIIIKGHQPEKISVILSTNTWDAYSVFAGASHYENTLIHLPTRYLMDFISDRIWLLGARWHSNFVPVRRPKNLFSEELAMPFDENYGSYMVRFELEFLVFLAKNGYSYSIYGDKDLDEDPTIQQSRLIAFPGHTEYWSDGMFYALDRYLAAGGKILSTMGGLEKAITYFPEHLKVRTGIPQEVVRQRFGTFPTSVGLFTASPFRADCVDSWVFSGTGIRDGDVFGEDSATVPSFDLPGHAHWADKIDIDAAPRRGASGFLTSKVGAGSGPFAMLAAGMNPQGPAHMVYRDTPEGGWVFNASSGTFNGALFRDPVIAQMMFNLLNDGVTDEPAQHPETTCR
jgi:N,N-dimethylformamidase beta subunit-like, C-terminal